MSDVSKTNELIEEARFYESPGHVAAYAEGTLELLRKLADALEAATLEQDSAGDIRRAVRLWSERFIPGDRWDTEDARDLDAALKCVVETNPDRSRARVPVQGEPNDDELVAIEAELAEWLAGKRSWCDQHHGLPNEIELTAKADEATIRLLIIKRDALTSRATVPDAATEAGRWYQLYEKGVEERVELRAELDATTAAIERVRALLHPTLGGTPTGEPAEICGCGKDYFPCDHAADILAALDGAPEPETAPENYEPKCNGACVVHGSPVTDGSVQYGRRNRETGAVHWLTGDPRDDWWHENQDRYEHVKRYTSPPLPVEGESKP